MKRGTPDHPKTKEFAELLGVRRVTALGHLELLFHFTASYAPAGDIGRYSDRRIAAALDWMGRPDKLIAALQQAGFIELHPTHRLVVHDWHEHADAAVRKRLERAKMPFVCFQQDESKLTRQSDPLLQTKSASSRALSVPMPTPEPTPMPLPDSLPLPPLSGKTGNEKLAGKLFDEFSVAYPVETGVDSALQWYLSDLGTDGKLETEHARVMAGLEIHLRSAKWRDKETGELDLRYIPNMAKFLGVPDRNDPARGRMYRDRPPPWKPPPKRGRRSALDGMEG